MSNMKDFVFGKKEYESFTPPHRIDIFAMEPGVGTLIIKVMKRKKRGRPLNSLEPRINIVGIRLNETETRCLSQYAWRYDQSMSEVVRQVLMVMSIIPES